MTNALDNTTVFVAPKVFSHQETPTLLGGVCDFHPHLSLRVQRCKAMGFEFPKARQPLHYTRAHRELTSLVSGRWFDKPKVLLPVFHASPAWILPPPSLISCTMFYETLLPGHLQVHDTLKTYAERT